LERHRFYAKIIKRVLDIVLSALGLILLSPLLFITALLVRVKLGRPVVYKQPRPGMNEKIFQLYKFRSMTNETDADGRLLSDAKRLTKFGKFLRASSLDELLELWNILKGDMSIVGPRPLSIYYLPHYPKELRRRHAVKPGLTGLAQVSGRNNLPWDERFLLDLRYVDGLSFGMDVKILWKTVLKVAKRSDVSIRGTTKVIDYGPYRVLQEEKDGGIKRNEMTYSEIGSYFWLDGTEKAKAKQSVNWLPETEDSCFTFSGRSAIDLAIRDILKERSIRRVLVPSYCCVSMLQAFVDRGIRIEFYEVSFEDNAFTYGFTEADWHTVVLIMGYFGLSVKAEREVIRKLHEQGAVVIEDITHSLLRADPASEYSNYLVASLRKWVAVPSGGWLGKQNGRLSEKPELDSNHAVEEIISAMREKYDYLMGKVDSKEHFLLAQAKFENDLIHVDRLLKIDGTSLGILQSLDIQSIRKTRRNNLKTLLQGLQDLNGKVLTLPSIDPESDVPLFLPVFLETEKRDSLRRELIERGIYCPVHWPEVMGAESGIRKNELSLILDQRYGEDDMNAIISAIHEWAREKIV
jgi:lipopolysaccharide/colanic/teichoic acid biosynthesis glycosyltransferase